MFKVGITSILQMEQPRLRQAAVDHPVTQRQQLSLKSCLLIPRSSPSPVYHVHETHFQVLDSAAFTYRGQSMSCQLSGTKLSASPLPTFKLDYLLIFFIFFLLLNCMSSLYILDIHPLSQIWFAKCFPPFCRMSFI